MSVTPEKLAEEGSESAHQRALMCWSAQQVANGVESLRWLYAIPNGGGRTASQGAALQAEGVKPGVADLFLMQGCSVYHGMYIEMKVAPNVMNDKQVSFANDALESGYYYALCYSWEEARNVIVQYLELCGITCPVEEAV
jgi:hypothetical protein